MMHNHEWLESAASEAEFPSRKKGRWFDLLYVEYWTPTRLLLDKDHCEAGRLADARCMASDLRKIRNSNWPLENSWHDSRHQCRRPHKPSKNDRRHQLSNKPKAKLFVKDKQLIPFSCLIKQTGLNDHSGFQLSKNIVKEESVLITVLDNTDQT